MYELIIFDVDGTLVDTESLYAQSLLQATAELGFSLGEERPEQLIYGRSRNNVFADIGAMNSEKFQSTAPLQQLTNVYFDSLLEGNDISIPSSVQLLKSLSKDYKLCLVSGSSRSHLKHYCELLSLDEYLAFYLGSEDYSGGKPDPSCFLKAANIVGVEPAQCLVFEDSNAGVSAAKAAGMTCVGLKRKNNKQDISHADLVLTDLVQFDFKLLK